MCVRVKRGVADSNQPGSTGQPQVYFEGAVAILRRLMEDQQRRGQQTQQQQPTQQPSKVPRAGSASKRAQASAPLDFRLFYSGKVGGLGRQR